MKYKKYWCIEKGEKDAVFTLSTKQKEQVNMHFWIEPTTDFYRNNVQTFDSEADALRFMMHPSRQWTEGRGYKVVQRELYYQ